MTHRAPQHIHRALLAPFACLALALATLVLLSCTPPPQGVPYPVSGFVQWSEVGGARPPARWGHVAVLDKARHRMIVWGGVADGVFRDDLWSLDLSTRTWQQLTASGGPSPRFTAAAIPDEARDRIIVVGGSNGSQAFGDVWSLDLGTLAWTEQPAGPPARYDAATTTDGTTAWVFGGYSAANQAIDDLWQLDLASGAWSELPATTRPSPRTNLGLAKVGDALLVTGGHTNDDALTADTWRYDLETKSWQQVPEANSPLARAHYAYATDPTCGLLLLFGGDRANSSDTNELLAVRPGPPASFFSIGVPQPPRRRHSAMVFDPSTRLVAVFGGWQGTTTTLDDTWIGTVAPCSAN